MTTTPYTRTVEDAPTVSVVGDVYALLARAEDTGGSLTVVHAIVPPGGGPPPHTHLHDDEAFFLIEGELDLTLGDESHRIGPGAFAFVPRGSLHAFKNATTAPVRMLFFTTPGGVDRVFTEAGAPLAPGAREPAPVNDEAIEKLLRACAANSIVVEPPTQA